MVSPSPSCDPRDLHIVMSGGSENSPRSSKIPIMEKIQLFVPQAAAEQQQQSQEQEQRRLQDGSPTTKDTFVEQLSEINDSCNNHNDSLPGTTTTTSTSTTTTKIALFVREEIEIGKMLGTGKYCEVYEVKGINLLRSTTDKYQEDDDLCSVWTRNCIAQHHAQRETSWAGSRYCIKFIKPKFFMGTHEEGFDMAAMHLENEITTLCYLSESSKRLHYRYPVNICTVRGMAIDGTEAYYNTGRYDSYFMILDRYQETLEDRLVRWRKREKLKRMSSGTLAAAGAAVMRFARRASGDNTASSSSSPSSTTATTTTSPRSNKPSPLPPPRSVSAPYVPPQAVIAAPPTLPQRRGSQGGGGGGGGGAPLIVPQPVKPNRRGSGGSTGSTRHRRGSGGSGSGGKARGSSKRLIEGTLFERLEVAYDMARAMEFLHVQNIVHRDLRPKVFAFFHREKSEDDDNETNPREVKKESLTGLQLVDLSHAQRLSDYEEGYIQDDPDDRSMKIHRYMAPEVLWGQPYDTKADVFSLTTLLCELVTLKELHQFDVRRRAATMCAMHLRAARNSTEDPLPKGILSLLEKGWSLRAEDRPTMSEVCESIRTVLISMGGDGYKLDDGGVTSSVGGGGGLLLPGGGVAAATTTTRIGSGGSSARGFGPPPLLGDSLPPQPPLVVSSSFGQPQEIELPCMDDEQEICLPGLEIASTSTTRTSVNSAKSMSPISSNEFDTLLAG